MEDTTTTTTANNGNGSNSVKVTYLLPEGFTPDEDSVIIGLRGKKVKNHAGNVRFQQLIERELVEYATAGGKTEKTYVVSRVLHEVRKWNPSKRAGFVRKDPDNEGRWFSVHDSKARSAVAQSFRDELGIAGQYKSSKESKKVKRRQTIIGGSVDDDEATTGAGVAMYPPQGPAFVGHCYQYQYQHQHQYPHMMMNHRGTGEQQQQQLPVAVPSQALKDQMSGYEKLAHIRAMVQDNSFCHPDAPTTNYEGREFMPIPDNETDDYLETFPVEEGDDDVFDFEPIPLDEKVEQRHFQEQEQEVSSSCCNKTMMARTNTMMPMPMHMPSLVSAMYSSNNMHHHHHHPMSMTRVVSCHGGVSPGDNGVINSGGGHLGGAVSPDAFAASEQTSFFFLKNGPAF